MSTLQTAIIATVFACVIGVTIKVLVNKYSKEYHNFTTPISVQQPKPGFLCFLATGNDGRVALSCVKE